MAKIYTKKGDCGRTGLYGTGRRVSKGSLLIEAIGQVDEVNSLIGLIRSEIEDERINSVLLEIQNDLFSLGAALSGWKWEEVDERVKALEGLIDEMEENLPPLKNFIIPSGSKSSSYLHLLRSVCRRAERAVVNAMEDERSELERFVPYLNRLSDLIFVMARFINKQDGFEDTLWSR